MKLKCALDATYMYGVVRTCIGDKHICFVSVYLSSFSKQLCYVNEGDI